MKKTVWALALVLASSLSFAQKADYNALSVDLQSNALWTPLVEENSILPILDAGIHFQNTQAFDGLSEIQLLSMALSALEEVMTHPPVGVKLEARNVARHLKLIITHSQSQTEIGRFAHEAFNMETVTGTKRGNEDAMTVMGVSYNAALGKINAIESTVVVYLDQVFERARRVSLPSGFKNQEAEAETLRTFQYLCVVLAHEIYGNAIVNFALDEETLTIMHQNPASARKDREVHAYAQGLQFIKEINDDHGFRIAERYNRWKPEAYVLAEHACFINGLINEREKAALKNWKNTKVRNR